MDTRLFAPTPTRRLGGRGRRAALVSALVGLGLAGAIVALVGVPRTELVAAGWQIGVGLASLLAVAWIVGGSAWRYGGKGWMTVLLIGAGCGLAALLLPAVLGASVSLFLEPDVFAAGTWPALTAWILRPLYWICLVGAGPAIILGMISAAWVRKGSAPAR